METKEQEMLSGAYFDMWISPFFISCSGVYFSICLAVTAELSIFLHSETPDQLEQVSPIVTGPGHGIPCTILSCAAKCLASHGKIVESSLTVLRAKVCLQARVASLAYFAMSRARQSTGATTSTSAFPRL